MTTSSSGNSGTTSASSVATSSSNAAESGSSLFNEENFMRKLDSVTPTQDSIQTLALWIIHHKTNHEIICRLWLRKLGETGLPSKQKLALFYLANDVIQNCKRKNAKVYQDTFKKCLNEAIRLVRVDSIKKNVERVLDVWLERQVYDKDLIDKLHATLKATNQNLTHSPPDKTVEAEKPVPSTPVVEKSPSLSKEEIEKIIAEFQPKNVCESISAFQAVTNETSLSKAQVEATRILDITLEHVKQYRDKNQCAKFKTEFENSCIKLEDYIRKLSIQQEQRRMLLKLMEQSEIFYDAQFKDAKTVSNAYRIYGSKVNAVKKKLDELINEKFSNTNDKLDQMDMEMSDEEPTSSQHLSSLLSNSTLNRSQSNTSLTNQQPAIKTHLDPRQNRQAQQPKVNSTPSKPEPKKRERSATPVRDENTTQNKSNPLDFLTKFINKSATNQTQSSESPTASTSAAPGSSSSSNLSYLVSSLQKFVNNSSTSSVSATKPAQGQFYGDPAAGLNYQSSFIQPETHLEQNRPGTPTKDEIYQQNQAQILSPTGYNHMMVSGPPPPPPPPIGYPPIFHPQAPPMNLIGMPPPPPGQLLIDPYHQMYNQPPPPPPPPPPHGFHYQPNKVLMSPVQPLMSVSTTSPLKADTPNINTNNNRNQNTPTGGGANMKRKYSNNFDEDRFQNNNINNNSNANVNKQFGQKNQQQQSFNRIPTINSQRDRGESNSGIHQNLNRSNSTSSKPGHRYY